MKNLKLLTTAFLIVSCTFIASAANLMLQGEFVNHLHNQLELSPPDAVLSTQQKATALTELNFTPFDGYKLDDKLNFGQLAVVFVRVLNLENKLDNDYKESDAIKLLVDEKVMDKQEAPDTDVTSDVGISLISKIPPVPGYAKKTLLLPRFTKKSDISPCGDY